MVCWAPLRSGTVQTDAPRLGTYSLIGGFPGKYMGFRMDSKESSIRPMRSGQSGDFMIQSYTVILCRFMNITVSSVMPISSNSCARPASTSSVLHAPVAESAGSPRCSPHPVRARPAAKVPQVRAVAHATRPVAPAAASKIQQVTIIPERLYKESHHEETCEIFP